jgi:hypothetical protein
MSSVPELVVLQETVTRSPGDQLPAGAMRTLPIVRSACGVVVSLWSNGPQSKLSLPAGGSGWVTIGNSESPEAMPPT